MNNLISKPIINMALSSKQRIRRFGLTLVELLIVIGILSVLTSIALPVTRTLIEESKVSESVRNVRVFLEAARAKAVSTGREHGVELVVAGSAGDGADEGGRVNEIKLVVGMPNYRGDVEGATCFLFHQADFTSPTFSSSSIYQPGDTPPASNLTAYANCAIFDATECPSLLRTLEVLEVLHLTNDNILNETQLSVSTGDLLALDGSRNEILGFSRCDGTEPPFVTGDAVAEERWVKLYFDPRGIVNVSGSSVATAPVAPTLPASEVLNNPSIRFWQRSFEIIRMQLRPAASSYTLQRGAAIDLYWSGVGASGQDFSPAGLFNLINIVVIFSPSGSISRYLVTQRDPNDGSVVVTSQVPASSVHLLVGRSDQIRFDLISTNPLLPSNDRTSLTNIVDTRSRWVSVNPSSGRITNTVVKGPRAGATSQLDQLINARLPALLAREQL